MATDRKPADLNKDGKVTPKERAEYRRRKSANENATTGNTPRNDKQDKLTEAELESRFGFAKDVIWQDESLRALYQRAIKEQMTPDAFQAALRDTEWYKTKADYARKAWAAERMGGADWEAQLQEGVLAVEDWAVQNGVRLTDEQKQQLGRRYWTEGWNDPDRQRLMAKELAGFIQNDEGFMRGSAGGFQQQMMQLARQNGMTFSEGYYQAAAQSVAAGLTMEDDWLREIREQAASKWPTYGDRIMSGMNMEDLASGYINIMANTWEVSPDSINLDSPEIKQALMGRDPQTGEPSMEGLWEFEQRLRSDPRWTNTKQGANTIADVGMDILRRMGFQS